jgi:hypothetical protein
MIEKYEFAKLSYFRALQYTWMMQDKFGESKQNLEKELVLYDLLGLTYYY